MLTLAAIDLPVLAFYAISVLVSAPILALAPAALAAFVR